MMMPNHNTTVSSVKFGANSISDGIMIIIPKVEIKKVLAAARHSREDKKMSSCGGHNDLTNKLFE